VPVGARPTTAVSYFDPNQQAPTSYQANLNIQHELGQGLTVEGGYIGNISHHLTGNDFSINQVPEALIGPGNTQAVRPFPQFSNVLLINPAIGNSEYHGVFGRVQKRFSGGFSLLAHYTYSRFYDDVESANEYGTSGSYSNQYDRRADWGRSASDVPHHVVVSVLYEVKPFTGHGIADAILAGWRIGLLETAQSGAPFTVVTASNLTNAFSAGPIRADLVGDPNAGDGTINRWFNTAAFATPAAFTFGNSPRSVLRGPALVTTDLTLERSVTAGGGRRLDFRVEAYNLLNRANYNIPGYTLGAADFGVISSARPARTVQLGARLNF